MIHITEPKWLGQGWVEFITFLTFWCRSYGIGQDICFDLCLLWKIRFGYDVIGKDI